MAKKAVTINKTFLIFILLVSPITLMALFSYVRLTSELTDLILSRRETVAQVSAQNIEEKFTNVIDTGIASTTRQIITDLVEAGRWQEAVNTIADVTEHTPYIERILLVDAKGILKADSPTLPDVHGDDFSFRDWYQGVSRNWEPYVSEVYKRTAEPRINIVSVAVPIKSEGQPIAILVMQIKLDTFLEWSKTVNIGDGGYMYIVDQHANVVAHPLVNPQADIVNFSGVPSVELVLKGHSGVDISANPFESSESLLTAYYPVGKYNWGVAVAQPEPIAFVSRDSTLMGLFIVFLILFVLDCLLAYVLTKVTNIIRV